MCNMQTGRTRERLCIDEHTQKLQTGIGLLTIPASMHVCTQCVCLCVCVCVCVCVVSAADRHSVANNPCQHACTHTVCVLCVRVCVCVVSVCMCVVDVRMYAYVYTFMCGMCVCVYMYIHLCCI